MKLELLQKAIEEEKNVFSEVNNAAYSLEPVSEERLVEIAKDVNGQLGYELYTLAFEVNEKLGYRLFRDIYSYSLKRDFEKVAKAVETYKKEGKITKFMK